MITQQGLAEGGVPFAGSEVPAGRSDASRSAMKALFWSTRFWFISTVLGQWVFTGYILAIYWLPIASGEPANWVDFFGGYDFAFMTHVALSVAIFVGGPLQFIPSLRKRFPQFHRWNGRVYLFSVLVTSAGGLYLIWVHGTVGGLGVQLGTSASALLVGVFAWQAVHCALKKDFESHRRWAVRLFITAAAVWYYRLQLMLWLVLSGGLGINPETFEGPALVITSFTQYLIPLAALEIYFYAKEKGGAQAHFALTVGLIVLTALTLSGTFLAAMGMWLPKLP